MQTTKVFESGNSQAVRLPKAFRFDEAEVEILRRGDEVVLRSVKKNVADALMAMPTLPDDCFAGDRDQGKLEERDWSGI